MDLLLDSYEKIYDMACKVWPHKNNNRKDVYIMFWTAQEYGIEDLKLALAELAMRQKFFPTVSEIHSEMIWLDKVKPRLQKEIPVMEGWEEKLRELKKIMSGADKAKKRQWKDF